MKNNILIAALAIAFVAPAQIFAQAKEGQTPEQQVQELIKIIKSEISERLPEYEETSEWVISISDSIMNSQGVYGCLRNSLGKAEYLWLDSVKTKEGYVERVSYITELCIKSLKFQSDKFADDLYQIGYVIDTDSLFTLVIYTSEKNPVTLEDLQKGSLKGTGINPGDLR